MNEFLWASGHLGWGIFAAVVVTGLWVLLADVYWRLKSTRMASLLGMAAAGWVLGVGVIVLVFYFSNR
jgi:riboflavin transporter FmnP